MRRWRVFGRRRCTVLELAGWSVRQLRAKMERIPVDELARRLLQSLPAGVRTLQRDLETNFRAVLRANLARLDLVARDEFDAQARVLERTRARLEALEAQVAALERARDSGASD